MADSEAPKPAPAAAAAGDEKKRKVLICIDASPQAEEAFNWYVENLHQPSSDLLLVHIADPPFVATQQVMYMSNELWTQMVNQEKERVRQLENQFADMMHTKGLSGRIKALFHSRAGEAIVDVAKEEHASMVVMGTRGLGAVRRTILGSVSDYVLHHVHCPVTIYRSPTPHDKSHAHDKPKDKK